MFMSSDKEDRNGVRWKSRKRLSGARIASLGRKKTIYIYVGQNMVIVGRIIQNGSVLTGNGRKGGEVNGTGICRILQRMQFIFRASEDSSSKEYQHRNNGSQYVL